MKFLKSLWEQVEIGFLLGYAEHIKNNPDDYVEIVCVCDDPDCPYAN